MHLLDQSLIMKLIFEWKSMGCLLGIQMRLQQFYMVDQALSLLHKVVTFFEEVLLLASVWNLLTDALIIVSEAVSNGGVFIKR
jgi:hypothetical protein